MSTLRKIINICDICEVEDEEGGSANIHTHGIALDGTVVELEACQKCWDKHTKDALKLIEVGRKPRKKAA